MGFRYHFVSLRGQVFSRNLNRQVKFRLVAPGNYWKAPEPLPVLLMNDGQDFAQLGMEKTLSAAFASKDIRPFIYVGLEANADRAHEYGISSMADFKGRGSRANRYADFVVSEFIPFLKSEFTLSDDHREWVYAGFSLGGLSAMDITLHNPGLFGKTGVFSGSFWWRKKAYTRLDPEDRSRIILNVIASLPRAPHLKFWFQCGTEDEAADRNNSGTIDAIEDTLDVIKELKKKGYRAPGAITYVEVEGGRHDLPTWGKVMPQFIHWAFGKGEDPVSRIEHHIISKEA